MWALAALDQLRDRLANKLPQANLKSRVTVKLSRRITPSMRLFLRQESQFKRRQWIGAAAAAVLVASGLTLWELNGKPADSAVADDKSDHTNPSNTAEKIAPKPLDPVVDAQRNEHPQPTPPVNPPMIHNEIAKHDDDPKIVPSNTPTKTVQSDPQHTNGPIPANAGRRTVALRGAATCHSVCCAAQSTGHYARR